MAIRRQLNDIGSAHASVLYQHYIENCRRQGTSSQQEKKNHKMIDMSSFLRNNLPQDIRKRYIENGTTRISSFSSTGISSFELTNLFSGTKAWQYRHIHPCPKYEDEEDHRVDLGKIYKLFVEQQEPGLVSNFRIGGEFSESTILQGPIDEVRYQQIVDDEKDGTAPIHSMILIGAYHNLEEDDRFWFLLQNTHRNDYFQLVDGEHVASSSSTIYFANRNIDMSLKSNYEIVVCEYSEVAFDLEVHEWHGR